MQSRSRKTGSNNDRITLKLDRPVKFSSDWKRSKPEPHGCENSRDLVLRRTLGYSFISSFLTKYLKHSKLQCGTWYHHPRRLQCVKFSKSQRDIIDAVTISKIIVFEIICNVVYFSAAKFTFPIEQPSNKATKCGIRGSWKLKLKPNLGCCNNIAIASYISVFVSSW